MKACTLNVCIFINSFVNHTPLEGATNGIYPIVVLWELNWIKTREMLSDRAWHVVNTQWVSVVAVTIIFRGLTTGIRKHTKIGIKDEIKYRHGCFMIFFLPDFLSHPTLETAKSMVCPLCIKFFSRTHHLTIPHHGPRNVFYTEILPRFLG